MTVMLVLGGVRSGKSRLAERLAGAYERVTYVAPGPVPDPVAPQDAEWRERVRAHQLRRPAHWVTRETGDVPGAINSVASESAGGRGAVLVDCLGTWTTRLIDDAGAWEERDRAVGVVEQGCARLGSALESTGGAGVDVILVSNEVGLGVVPAHVSGRLFRDALGQVNQCASAVADRMALVVAGRVVDLTGFPTVDDVAMGWGNARFGRRGA